MQAIEAWKKFNAIAGALGQDPERYERLQKAEARYWGLGYAHRRHAWNEEQSLSGAVIALSEKRPLREYNLARRATDDVVDLLCGEGRFPSLLVLDNPSANEALPSLAEHTKLEAMTRELAMRLVSAGSGAITLRLDAVPAQHLTLDVWSARYCIPTFGDNDPQLALTLGVAPRDLLALRVQYAYAVNVPGRSEPDWYIFRRDHDHQFVVDYEPWKIPSGVVTEIPRFIERLRVEHGLGRVPAAWVRSRHIEGEVDGESLYEVVESLLEGIDTNLSLLDSSVQHNTNPMPVFEGIGAEELGRAQIKTGLGNTLCLPMQAGVVPKLTYPSHSGESHRSAREHIGELRRMALEVMRVVLRRDDENSGALSGTALQILFRPMLALVGGYRTAMTDAIRQVAELLLIAGARYRNTLRTHDALAVFEPGRVVVDWPPVFAPTSEEIASLGGALGQAVMAQMLSRDTAIEQFAALLQIKDVEAEKAQIDDEREEGLRMAREQFGAAGDDEPGDDDSEGANDSAAASEASDSSAQ